MMTFLAGFALGAVVCFPAGMLSMARWVQRHNPLAEEKARLEAAAEQAAQAGRELNLAREKADAERLKRQFHVPQSSIIKSPFN